MNITKEMLEDLYLNQGLSVRECAEKLGLPSHGGISWRLKKFGIKTRPNRFRKGNQVNKGRRHFGEENANWKGGKKELSICIDCNKEFYTYPSEKNNYQRCGECRTKNQISNELKGKKFGSLTVIGDAGRVKWEGGSRRLWLCKCDCGQEHTVRANDLKEGKTKSCGCEQGLTGEKNPKWIGGKSAISFDTYAEKIQFAEEVRRSPNNNVILETRCTYCGRWFKPSLSQISQRIRVLHGQRGNTGECRLYCSKNCKTSCPTYRKKYWPEGYKPATSREVQPQLRHMRLEIDDYTCQKCGKTIDEAELHCHHYTGTVQNPIESADVDNTITLCKLCHKWVHTQEGCRYFELRCGKKDSGHFAEQKNAPDKSRGHFSQG